MKKSISLICTLAALVLGSWISTPAIAQEAAPETVPETTEAPSATESPVEAAPTEEAPTESPEGEESSDASDAVETEDGAEEAPVDAEDNAPAVAGSFNYEEWTPMLGRFHPLVLHFPIGVLFALFLLELAYIFRKFQNIEPAHWFLLIIGTLGAITAAAFGWFLSWEGGYDEVTIFRHKWTGVGVAGLCVLAIFVRAFYSYTMKHRIRHAYRGILILIVALLCITGHYGGNLTHGEDYLFENVPDSVPIPEFIYSKNEAPLESGSTYADVIHPILKAQCYECHSESKSKGDYQLTTRELMLTPGESGENPVVPGDAFASPLVRLIALPEEHDDLMPPSGKGTLTGDEILAIMQWIDRGADFGDGAHVIEIEVEKPEMTPAVIDTSDLDADGAVDFVKHIWPIIEASCLECHNAEKQKGELRLDTKAFILTGGEFGSVIEPGLPDDSTFYELVTLDEDDPDFMPAKNEPLPDEQIELIKRWIEEGADFGEWTGE